MRHRADQTAALTRTFVARFFDNEMAAGSGDLAGSFFGLIAFLAPLGLLMPWMLTGTYEALFYSGGIDLVRLTSLAHKTFYLTFTTIVSAGVTVLTWDSLLVDRRDALVLGVLPVTRHTIVRAKLRALGIYVGLVAVGMHAAGAVSFGFVLSAHNTFFFAIRGVAAHLIACGLASILTFLVVLSAQTLVRVALPARLFARVSPWLQMLVTGAVATLLLALPLISNGAIDAVTKPSSAASWMRWLPPLWCLGVYETVLGTASARLHHLALAAIGSASVLLAFLTVAYPAASARSIGSAVEGTAEATSARVRRRMMDVAIRALTPTPAARGSVQMLAATAARVSTHRFVLALGGGLIAAFLLPIAASAWRADPSPLPPRPVLAAPLIAIAFSLVALRITAAFPSEVKGAWIVSAVGPLNRHTKAGVRSAMLALGVVPWLIGTAVGLTRQWGAPLAGLHVCLCLAVGLMLAEALLYQFEGMPCTRRWAPENANLKKWWPLYLFGFLVITRGVPSLTLAVYPASRAAVVWIAVIAASATWLLRRVGARPTPLFDPEDEQADTSFT